MVTYCVNLGLHIFQIWSDSAGKSSYSNAYKNVCNLCKCMYSYFNQMERCCHSAYLCSLVQQSTVMLSLSQEGEGSFRSSLTRRNHGGIYTPKIFQQPSLLNNNLILITTHSEHLCISLWTILLQVLVVGSLLIRKKQK